jgi:CheY-like chemotaxis protein
MNTSSLAGKNILVVEDNAINQMLVRHSLSKSGATIDIANNGNYALTFIESNTYDIILMDLFMPELDGYQTTQIIRKELHLNIPIVAMTTLPLEAKLKNVLAWA